MTITIIIIVILKIIPTAAIKQQDMSRNDDKKDSNDKF
jgi:hypothetical protein